MVHFRRKGLFGQALWAFAVFGLVGSSTHAAPNSFEVPVNIRSVIQKNCAACHEGDSAEAGVRFDGLASLDRETRLDLLGRAQEQVFFGLMPPADEAPLVAGDRNRLLDWTASELGRFDADRLREKLARPEYGNHLSHEALFSGEHADEPASTADRRWLISEFIFNEKVNRLLDYQPSRGIDGVPRRVSGDSGIHWSPKTERGNAFRRTITNPFLLPDKVGVRYFMHDALTAGHLLTMIGNAKRIAGHMSSERTMAAHYPAMHALMKTELRHREILRSRERFLTTHAYMDRLLEDIYGDDHARLLPKLERVDVPYPGLKLKNGMEVRNGNLGFLPRFDSEDVTAIFRAIATYKNEGATEIDRADFDEIIRQGERDWFVNGDSDYRIKNRITTMKVFYDQWEMDKLLVHIDRGNHTPPKYVPLDDGEMSVIVETIRKHREKGDHYRSIVEKCIADWEASFRAEREATRGDDDERVGDLVDELYARIFEREPTESERAENVSLMRSYMEKLERQQAIAKLIESLILSTEFAYRYEFGTGEPDEHGRRMLSPRDASYALAYALTDASPDAELANAAAEGRLSTRDDYEREVRRMLARRDQWYIVDEGVQAANLNASVTNLPVRKLRFFREFFGYPGAMNVFKDDARFGAGRHTPTVSRLIDEADLLVAHILERDERVFETLLTTEEFYVYHSGDNEAMLAAAENTKRAYEYFIAKNWESWSEEDLAEHRDMLQSVWELRGARDAKSQLRGLKQFMERTAVQLDSGQQYPMPYMKVAKGFWHGGPAPGRTGQQMRGEQVTSYWNVDWRTWDYPARQPAKMPHRKGMLSHPAWLIAHSQNLESDPIHRGKWIREKLLAGLIPDVPITVDAVIPEDHTKTLRQRMENRTGDAYCWRCHQKMDPLGFAFEIYDDFGRYRTEERLEHPDNLITPAKDAPLVAGAQLPVYETLPVDPRGVLRGTGDPTLDGEVEDAFDMIDRLAKSDRVRQSIIRHAFRYFLGRNETLSDSKTLIDADRAYLDSGGSFDAVIVSLLTSDSFVYRTAPAKD